MTVIEKAKIIELKNFLEEKGEESRRNSRKQDVQYIQGWLAGSGNARKECAEYLQEIIDSSNIGTLWFE